MQIPIVSFVVLCSSAIAVNIDDPTALLNQLNNWKTTDAGKYAIANGLAKPKQESLSSNNDELLAFAETVKTVAQLNAQHTSAKFSINNPFATMTNDQFAAWVKSSSPERSAANESASSAFATVLPTATASVPSTLDWSTTPCVAPVKNQGVCGSCFAFAAVAAAESAYCLANNNKLTTFSDQQVLSCGYGMGCSGGWSDQSLSWMVDHGLCTDSDYPYTNSWSMTTASCQSNCKPVKMPFTKVGAIYGEIELQQALLRQPIAVDISGGSAAFKNYASGVLSSGCSTNFDHVILAVGYGTDGLPFYKMKNSWGPYWGESGFLRIQRNAGGVGTCGLARHSQYPIIYPSFFGIVTSKDVAIYEYYSDLYAGTPSGSANEQWQYNPVTYQLIVNSNQQCLDAWNTGNGYSLHTYNCDASNGNQQWIIDSPNRRIKHRVHPNLCLDVDPNQNNKVQVWTCYDKNPNQQFAPTEEEVRITSYNNLVLATFSNILQFGAEWVQYTWVVNNVDHTIRGRRDLSGSPDMCLDAYQPWNGGIVHMWSCDKTNANQKWKYDPTTKQIRHLTHTGFCLDMANDQGSTPYLYSCTQPANNYQAFTYTSITFPATS
ncbi:cysteine protease family C01A [Thraustotheca clavata]|uniref:Cysteine protease family C01A n=1 Tax=Thraustotheca clavata TaxID=74557 RepID=A0A0A7CM06_9STRA|nr:secreted protein [Thraustotheca clavata]OQS03294.1 cysteine protease family C01A [Thraustotheca clavata]